MAEHTPLGKVVFRVGRVFAEVADDAVGRDVDIHSKEENKESEQESWVGEPGGTVVVLGGDKENPAALHDGVQGVEGHAHQNDGEWHLAVAANL